MRLLAQADHTRRSDSISGKFSLTELATAKWRKSIVPGSTTHSLVCGIDAREPGIVFELLEKSSGQGVMTCSFLTAFRLRVPWGNARVRIKSVACERNCIPGAILQSILNCSDGIEKNEQTGDLIRCVSSVPEESAEKLL